MATIFYIFLVVLLLFLVILLIEVMQLNALFMMLRKDKDLLQKRSREEDEYQFVKGLY